MTDEEFTKLVAVAEGRPTKDRPTPGERFVEFISFLRLTGARTVEAARLKWTDIDLAKAVITLTRHKTSKMQRQPKPRVIPLLPEVVSLLIAIRQRQEPGELLFHNHAARPGTAATYRFACVVPVRKPASRTTPSFMACGTLSAHGQSSTEWISKRWQS